MTDPAQPTPAPTEACRTSGHTFTVTAIQWSNGDQTPIVVCDRCDTVWHRYTAARRGDLVLIPGHEPPTEQMLAAASELAEQTGVHLAFVDAEPTITPTTRFRNGFTAQPAP